jgi:hypothetical protein
MPSDLFQMAAKRAAASYPPDVWRAFSPSEQAAAIYRELRKLDAEAASSSEKAVRRNRPRGRLRQERSPRLDAALRTDCPIQK